MNLYQEDIETLTKMVEDGYIRKAVHPRLPLSIYNYTTKTQYEGLWNKATRACRGLILDDSHNVVVRPPEKFFNVGEPFAANVDLLNAAITEKADGYMIMIKIDPDWGLIVASRGSFTSQYAEATKEFITDDTILKMTPGYTYFCELLQNFPGDEAIILTKHPTPKLVCWAIRDEDFNELPLDEECPFPTVEQFSFAEAKQYLERKVEGVVAQDTKTFERVKIKTDWFREHHRLLSGCTKKRVWEILSKGEDLESLDIPDEFMQQMEKWEDEIQHDYSLISLAVENEYEPRKHLSDKEIALDNSLSKEIKSLIFTLKKKGTDALRTQIWQKIKPSNVV